MSTVATPDDGLRRRPRRWLAPAPWGPLGSHRWDAGCCCRPYTVPASVVASLPRNTLLRGPVGRHLPFPAACYMRSLSPHRWPWFPPPRGRTGWLRWRQACTSFPPEVGPTEGRWSCRCCRDFCTGPSRLLRWPNAGVGTFRHNSNTGSPLTSYPSPLPHEMDPPIRQKVCALNYSRTLL